MSGEASGGVPPGGAGSGDRPAPEGQPRVEFKPKEELLNLLLETGITRNAAVKGLLYTGNYSADLAAAWVFGNEGREDLDAPLSGSESDDVEEADFLEAGDFHKMVFAVNMDLKMGVGKVAAQVGHASIGLYRELCENQTRHGAALLQWEQFGETKIVVKAHSAMHLEELQAKAVSLELATYMVQDAGRTQVASGSMTVVGIMGRSDAVDRVTGALQLL